MLVLTPDALEGAYEFLRRTTKQFKILPHVDVIEFHVTRDRNTMAHFVERRKGKKRQWVIGVSDLNVGHTFTLIRAMAHEMIHLHQALRGTENRAQHNKEFVRIALAVAAQHGFDPKEL